jgi:hypothetical protein
LTRRRGRGRRRNAPGGEWEQGPSQEFYVRGAKFEFFLQSHSYNHILSQLRVLTSFTYIFVFHLGQNKRSYEAIKHGYMNNFHIRCRGFEIFLIHRGALAPAGP